MQGRGCYKWNMGRYKLCLQGWNYGVWLYSKPVFLLKLQPKELPPPQKKKLKGQLEYSYGLSSEFGYPLCSVAPQSCKTKDAAARRWGQTEGGCWELLQPAASALGTTVLDLWWAGEVIYVKTCIVTQCKWSYRCNDVLNQNKLVQNLNQ